MTASSRTPDPTTDRIPDIKLNDGHSIPQFGFGVFQIPPEETAQAVRTALAAGYRHIDTAQGYQNEQGVGDGIAQSGLSREDVFVTTKLANEKHAPETAASELDLSLRRLGTDYVDLYLIHWPMPAQNRFVETWQAFEQIAADGRARSIGVSNFTVAHLERIAAETGTVPAVNQIELHPLLVQDELQTYHREHGIATEAWSPIAQGEVLGEETIVGLAEKYDKTPAQIVLRWHIQIGTIVFPKSSNPSRISENIDIFDFELADDDVDAISALDAGHRTGLNPDTFG
jgi:2,5-diketo-D-gluconate reductase A